MASPGIQMLFYANCIRLKDSKKHGKKTGRAINKRDAGNATKAGELGAYYKLASENCKIKLNVFVKTG